MLCTTARMVKTLAHICPSIKIMVFLCSRDGALNVIYHTQELREMYLLPFSAPGD
jgi:hypothetical protein